MTYTKPELVTLTPAVEAIQTTQVKNGIFQDGSCGPFDLDPAYEADE